MAELENKTNGKGNIFRIIIIILLAILLIGGGTFAGYYVATKMKPAPVANNVSNNNFISSALDQKTFSLDEFIVNLKADNSSRYLKTKIFIGYRDVKENKKLEEELNFKKHIMRDYVNMILRTKKVEEFDEKGVEKLKKDIRDKINPILKEGQICDVYFSEIIVQ